VSDAMKAEKRQMEVGSRRWWWAMRGEHATLWVLPALPVFYALNSQGKHHWHGASAVFYAWTPWIFFTVALVVTMRATWRTEVNLAANGNRPFTPKDGKALRWATMSSLGCSLYATVLGSAHPSGMPKDDWSDISDGLVTVMLATLIIAILTASMERMHSKGAHAYEELEKGV